MSRTPVVIAAPHAYAIPGASVSGGQREIDYVPGSLIEISASWDVRNEGDLETMAGIKTRLISDLRSGDATEMVSEASLAADSNAVRMIAGLNTNYPKLINPGRQETLSFTMHIKADELWKIQGKFRLGNAWHWWMLRLDIMDALTGKPGEGDHGYEIRDWFKLVD
tara:strand:+ start:253 stop:750 length:498 start_codon:yes stop_codon:yes gene_type:complete